MVKMVMNDCISLPLLYQDSNIIPVQDHDRDRVTVNVAQGTAGLINVALRFPIKSTKAQKHKSTNAQTHKRRLHIAQQHHSRVLSLDDD